jgi:predicted RNase H-like nuclease (RuvC/YqgF family)
MTAKLWEDIKKGAQETLSYLSEKTEELTTIGRLKVEIANVRKKMEGQFRELGKYVYEAVERDEASKLGEDEKVRQFVSEISTLEKQLREKEEELKSVGRKKEESSSDTESEGAQPAENPTA